MWFRNVLGAFFLYKWFGRSLSTTHIQRMGEGNIFSLCVSSYLNWGEYPSQVQTGGAQSQVQTRVTLSQVWMGGTRSCWWGGILQSQVWMGGYPIQDQDRGVPWGTSPIKDWMGSPGHPGLDGVTPPPVRRQISIGSTCYAMWRAVCSCVHAGGLSCYQLFWCLL